MNTTKGKKRILRRPGTVVTMNTTKSEEKTEIAETWDCGNNEYYEERRKNGNCGDLGLG